MSRSLTIIISCSCSMRFENNFTWLLPCTTRKSPSASAMVGRNDDWCWFCWYGVAAGGGGGAIEVGWLWLCQLL